MDACDTGAVRRPSIGTGVSAIINRYHPANVAHQLATLAEMHPDRVFLGLGPGEAINESPFGNPMPEPSERRKRTAEAIRIIRRLFEEEFEDEIMPSFQ